jgi:cytosine/adenosine deaminase-related metal-dependent hydrolase
MHQGLVGLHASFTVSDHTLYAASQLALKYKTGIHIHVAEDGIDQKNSMERHGQPVIKRLQKYDFLNMPATILVHCLYLNDEERLLLRNSGSWIAINVESNLKNNVGMFNSAGLSENIMLGTDGMHSDMLRASKATYFSSIKTDKITPEKLYKRFRNVHKYILQNGFEGDGDNNLVVLDYTSPTEMNADNFLSHFIFGLESKHIQHVISDGRLIIKDRKLIRVEENEILEFSKAMGNKLWKKLA